MNRRGLVMAKNVLRRAHSGTTKLLTIHSRSAPVFLSNARGEPTFGLCRQKGFNKPHSSLCAKKVLIPDPRDRRSSLCFMMLQKIAGGGDFVKKQILRGDRNLSKLLRDESHREAVAFFFRRFFCFQVVLRRSILIPRRLGEHALQS